MKFSENWLREWVAPSLTTRELCEQLTMLGLEVDAVVPAAPDFSKVVVGEIVAAAQHPNADRLRCCQVDVGGNEPLSIVCGAPNARIGIKVAVALVGAVLPGDFKIKKSKLRGEPSLGMICSAKELCLSDDEDAHAGIIELAADAPVGEDFRTYWQLDDQLIDIELTPNRGDCASICGIAREVALANQMQFKDLVVDAVKGSGDAHVKVKVSAQEQCPSYFLRVIKNINTTATTPLWMREKLRRSAMRCIHPVVDVLNYVMLELGQPMHAFDIDKLQGDISVRLAKQGETIKLLDEQTVRLSESTLVIADQENPLAIAGVMGGFDSAVNEGTQNILLESAFFDPVVIRLAAKKYNIQTDSSYRFERGVDFQLQCKAMERVTGLLLEIVGGEACDVIEAVATEHLPERPMINMPHDAASELLGVEFKPTQVADILSGLGMVVQTDDVACKVTPPSYRFDIERSIDLVEEVARVYGYQNIPMQVEVVALTMHARSESELNIERLQSCLVDSGYQEVVNYSFVAPKLQDLLLPKEPDWVLQNPISADMSVMRRTLFVGLLNSVMYNQRRQSNRQRFFEIGRVFNGCGSDQIMQPYKLAMVCVGPQMPLQWGQPVENTDFFDLKQDVERLLSLTGRREDFTFKQGQQSALHPAQCSELYDKDELVGYLGVLHPTVVKHYGLKVTPVLFEMDLAATMKAMVPDYVPIGKFPCMQRDIAIVVDQQELVDNILNEIIMEAGELLDKCDVFDVYQGEGIEDGKKSIALGLTFRDTSRTLVDEEISDIVHRVVKHLQRRFNAKMRA